MQSATATGPAAWPGRTCSRRAPPLLRKQPSRAAMTAEKWSRCCATDASTASDSVTTRSAVVQTQAGPGGAVMAQQAED